MSKGKTRSEWEKYQGVYIIPVMGPTGAGKSTFINRILGKEFVKVGHSLHSCTVDLQPVEIPIDLIRHHLPLWNPKPQNQVKLILVDTPGFDDTSADDSEILKRIAEWLANTYGAGAKLAGVIHLQDICQRRVTNITKRNFDVFDKLCGPDACKSVVLGTTQWHKLHSDDIMVAQERERELRDMFWRDMIKKGSTMQRLDDRDSNASPWKLMETVLYKGELATLRIQRELRDMDKIFPQTEAASVLSRTSLKSSAQFTSPQIGSSNLPPMILVLGMTGVGKSTFIRSAGPKGSQPTINNGLFSSQTPIEEFEAHSADGQTVSLVDTPGFNDTEKSDKLVLDDIIKFLRKERRVAGIIFLLDASNRDYTPVSAGKIESPPAVVLVTVNCHAMDAMPDEAKSLLQKKYGPVYQGDHFGTRNQHQTAWSIICRVLDSNPNGVAMELFIRNLEGILQSRNQAWGKGETLKQLLLQIFRFMA